MPSLLGRSPASAYPEFLKINNTGAGIDGTLRNVEDGSGNQTGIQLGTNMVAIFGYQFPASGFAAGQVLRINAANNAFEWHTLASTDLSDIDLYAPIASPSFTGVPTAPTALMGTNNTQIANTAFVNAAIPTQVSHLANDAGYVTASTVPVTSVAGRTGAIALAVTDVNGAAPLASPVLTGSPTTPTASLGTNTTQISSTAFVQSAIQNKPYRRNAILNGGPDLWQRGSSWTTPTSGTYTADKWRIDYTGTTPGVFAIAPALKNTQPANLTAELGPNGVFSWNQTTAPNLTSLMLSNRCESITTLSGQTVTVSFSIALGAGSQSSFQIGVNLAQCWGTGGSPSATVTQTTQYFTVNSSTFTRFQTTFTLPSTSGTLGTNNNDYLALQFVLPTNQLFSFYLAQVQVEPGSVATPYMVEDMDITIMKCRRFFRKTLPISTIPQYNTGINETPLLINQSSGLTTAYAFWEFDPPMRNTPTVIFYTVGNNATPINQTGVLVNTPSSLNLGSASLVLHATADADL
jgi:hypothetical protein